MQEVLLDYGDAKMRVELPDSATVVRYGKTYQDPPAIDNRRGHPSGPGQSLGPTPPQGDGRA